MKGDLGNLRETFKETAEEVKELEKSYAIIAK